MRRKFNLHAIPVCLAALAMWALSGGWYVSFAPMNLAGPDNIGIVLSLLGVCLFVADRLAFLWLKVHCWVVFLKTWVWGLVFLAWGLLEWLHFISGRYLIVFFVHWLIILLVITCTLLLIGRRGREAE